jgi:hypothetical protein
MAEFWEAELCGAGTVAELDDLARLAGWSTSGIFCVTSWRHYAFFAAFEMRTQQLNVALQLLIW